MGSRSSPARSRAGVTARSARTPPATGSAATEGAGTPRRACRLRPPRSVEPSSATTTSTAAGSSGPTLGISSTPWRRGATLSGSTSGGLSREDRGRRRHSRGDGHRGDRGVYHALVSRFLHTMVRITDPEKSRAFYEALGFTFAGDFDIVRDGEVEATNYFFSMGDQES